MNCLGGLFIRNKPADKVEAFVTSEAQQEGDEQLGLVVEVEDTVVNDCEGLQGSSPVSYLCCVRWGMWRSSAAVNRCQGITWMRFRMFL